MQMNETSLSIMNFGIIYFNHLIVTLVVIIIILIVIFILAFGYKRSQLRKYSAAQHNREEQLDSLFLLSSGMSSDNIDSAEIQMEYCSDIMNCKCAFNLGAVFNSNDKIIKNANLFWKESEVIAETFNCEIRKVDLLVANKLTCMQHSGGIVKKLKNKCTWSNELSIYQLGGLQHDNVLVFLDAYQHRTGALKYSLITAEAHSGSLYSYLMKSPWQNFQQCLSVITGIVAGVTHLHSCSIPLKPPIVHRDLKSKNILLKLDLTPCIADFGLATILKNNFKSNKDVSRGRSRVGTQRYMAPEILAGTIGGDAPSYLSSDVYAMALVLWEVLSQCPSSPLPGDGPAPPQYCLPFTLELHSDVASLERMVELVCVQAVRPRPQAWWILDQRMRLIWTTIQDCWEQLSEERISASLVRERLKNLGDEWLPVSV